MYLCKHKYGIKEKNTRDILIEKVNMLLSQLQDIFITPLALTSPKKKAFNLWGSDTIDHKRLNFGAIFFAGPLPPWVGYDKGGPYNKMDKLGAQNLEHLV